MRRFPPFGKRFFRRARKLIGSCHIVHFRRGGDGQHQHARGAQPAAFGRVVSQPPQSASDRLLFDPRSVGRPRASARECPGDAPQAGLAAWTTGLSGQRRYAKAKACQANGRGEHDLFACRETIRPGAHDSWFRVGVEAWRFLTPARRSARRDRTECRGSRSRRPAFPRPGPARADSRRRASCAGRRRSCPRSAT